MRFFFVLLSLVVSPGVLTAQNTPAPSEVTIDGVTYSGDGCAPGTVAPMVSGDGKAFTLFFSDFAVSTERRGVIRKACAVRLNVTAPRSYEFALVGIDYRGYMDISEKSMLKFSARALTGHGNSGEKIFDIKFKGPKADEFFFPVRSADGMKWSGCASERRSVAINTSVHLQTATGGGGLVVVDSMDGEFRQNYLMSWRRCVR